MTTSSTELNKVVVQLQRIGRAIGQYSPEAWLELNLTFSQLKSLLFIDSVGRTNFRKLASALAVTPPDVTRIIDRLVEQGLVSRRENPEDRRMQLLQATKKGKDLLAKLTENRTAQLHSILAHLSAEELTTLAQGLDSLVKAAELQQEEITR